jgi:hypothetical protein
MSVNSKMTALADGIRELSGTTTTKSIDTMTSDVNTANTEIAEQTDLIAQITGALENKAAGGGGVELPELTNPAATSDILSGKEAIDENGKVLTGTIATKTSSNLTASGATVTVPSGYYATNATKSVTTATQATPSVSINSSGLITASATQTAGYVSAGTKSGTKQLTTQAAKTVTPTTSNQTAVASGRYTTGAITVKGDANLKAENIAEGVSIFGVTGTHSGAEDLNTELTEQENLISQLSTILDSKASGGSGGGSVETCAVELSTSAGCFVNCIYTYLDNGQIASVGSSLPTNPAPTSISLNNIICGSYIAFNISTAISLEQCNGFERVLENSNVFWRVTAGAGETANIKFYSPF